MGVLVQRPLSRHERMALETLCALGRQVAGGQVLSRDVVRWLAGRGLIQAKRVGARTYVDITDEGRAELAQGAR